MQFDFFQKKEQEPSEGEEGEKKAGIDFSGLAQLMTMGAGAPSLGEFTGMEDNKMMFELEGNNFSDEDGNIKKGAYMEDGWVDESEEEMPNPFSGFLDMFRQDKK